MLEADNIFEQAKYFTENAEYQKAIALLQKVLPQYKNLKKWVQYVHTCNEIGKNFNHLSQPQDALRYLQFSLQKAAQTLHSNHLQSAHAHNNIGYTYSLLGDYDKVLHHYQQALHIFEHHYVDNLDSDLAMIHSNLGWIYGQRGNIPQAIIHHQQAIHIYLHTLGNIHQQTAIAYNNTGYVYGLKNDYANALLYYQQAFNIWEQTLGKDHTQLIHAYNNIGWCYRMNEQFGKALEFYEKALDLSLTKFGENHSTTAQIYSNMGSCFSLQNDFNASIEKYQQALHIQQSLYGNEHPNIAQSWMNIGIVKGKQKSFDQALSYLKQSLKLYLQFVSEKHPRIAMVCNEIANVYRRSGQFEKAIAVFHQVLQNVLPNYSSDDVEAIPSIEGFRDENALLYALNGKAASFLEIQTQNSNANANANSNENENENENKQLNIQNSTNTQKQLSTQTPKNTLKSSLGHFEAAVELIQQIRQSYKADESKLSLSKSILPVYEGGIRAALALFAVSNSPVYLQKAFDFSEQGKSMVLLENLKGSNALVDSNIPRKLQGQLQELELELKYLDKKIAQEQVKNTKSETAQSLRELQQKHFDFHTEYQRLIEDLEREYADYFQLKYVSQNIDIEVIQEHIGAKAVFIEYFVGEDSLFIFAIGKEKYGLKAIEKPSDFLGKLDDFHRAIEWMDEEAFVAAANDLYALLLQPIEEYWSEKEELLIVRDDVLHLLAFDALLLPTAMPIEDAFFADLPYLIHNYVIAYHYSAHLWQRTRNNWNKQKRLNDSFLGIAPVVFQQTLEGKAIEAMAWKTHRGKTQIMRNTGEDDGSLQNLPSTALEVKQVYELFHGRAMDAKLYLYAAASKKVFFEEVPKHDYVLIATHGFVHDEYQNLSGIYLADTESKGANSLQKENKSGNYLLTIPEIYHLKLKAKLVVLSSCSSGLGKLYRGEGMMALNRVFLYAGASNIIFTQFDIPDESSSKLVQHLFEYILEENSYAKALQKAKIKCSHLEDNSPQDWAGFAYIGILEGKQEID